MKYNINNNNNELRKSISCPTSPKESNLKRCYSDSKLYDKNESYLISNNNNIYDNDNNKSDMNISNSQSEDVILPIENLSNQILVPPSYNNNENNDNENSNNKSGSFISSDILEESMFL